MATPLPGTQTIRFRRPTNQSGDSSASSKPSSVTTRKNRHAGILQDQLRRSQKAPWCPSFSLAFRIFLLIRVTGAMYVGLNDCDEGEFYSMVCNRNYILTDRVSVQFLGTFTLSASWTWVPDVGDLSRVLYQELGLYPAASLAGKAGKLYVWA